MLCENTFNGGGGYTPQEVGQMSLDQIWFRLCNIEILKRGDAEPVKTVGAQGVSGLVTPDRDGYIKGRAEDGTPIKAKMSGKSLARMIREEQEEKARKEKRKEKRKRRRK
jgi:hypothetical protein